MRRLQSQRGLFRPWRILNDPEPDGVRVGLGACAVELVVAEGFPVRVRSGGRSRSIVGTMRRKGAPERAEVGESQGRHVLPRRLS